MGLTITGTSTPTLQAEEAATFNPAQIREFTPQGYDLSNSVRLLFLYTLLQFLLYIDVRLYPFAALTYEMKIGIC
jgi:hypothetical protein